MAISYITTRRPGTFAAVTLLAILVAGLWPFRFHPANGLEWLHGENGIYFYNCGMVMGEDNDLPAGPSTVEMQVRPRRRNGRDIARILSIYGGGLEGFYVGQWKSYLILGSTTRDTGGRESYQEATVGDVLPRDSVRFITITRDKDGTGVYLDGVPANHYQQFTPVRTADGTAQRLILGNSPTGRQYWTGEMLGLAVYNRRMTKDEVSDSFRSWEVRGRPPLSGERAPAALYLFDEHEGGVAHNRLGHGRRLLVPERFEPLEKLVLVPPWRDFKFNMSYMSDIAYNLAAFVPLGFFMAAFMLNTASIPRWRAFAFTILIGFGLSLSIELVQAFLPARNSQLSDVITNAAGTLLGAFLLSRARAS